MAFDIDSLVGKRVETTFEFAGESMTVWYDPTVVTKDRIVNADSNDENFTKVFCDLIVDWEVTQGGTKVPIKTDAIDRLPITFLRALFFHIVTEGASGQMGKVSSAPSRRRVPKDRQSPSSTGSSKSRSGSGSRRGS